MVHKPPIPDEGYPNDGHRDQEATGLGRGAIVAIASAALLAGMATAVQWQTRRAERRYPPVGRTLSIDGVRLHYLDTGHGSPIVLVHGNASLLQDPLLGLGEQLADRHRLIAFDRPGFGYSERPDDRDWTPEAQADLIATALTALGIGPVVLYGHSFGTTVVLSLALRHPAQVAGIALASGYYFPERRLDQWLATVNALPGIGWLTRNTVAPLFTALTGDALVKASFAPDPVSPAYDVFPADLVVRPTQLRAAADDARTLYAWSERTSRHYPMITPPVLILAGGGDRLIDPEWHACRLAEAIPHARLHLWPTAGHMLHHSRGAEVAALVGDLADRAETQARTAAAARGDAVMATAV